MYKLRFFKSKEKFKYKFFALKLCSKLKPSPNHRIEAERAIGIILVDGQLRRCALIGKTAQD